MVQVRRYLFSDCEEIMQLFYNTVHTINIQDYNQDQVDAWAPQIPNRQHWRKTLSEHYSLVAEMEDQIVGFCDIDDTGYLDHIFVHQHYQGQNIATVLLDKVETYAIMTGMEYIITHVSITAKSFFLRRGFIIIKKQTVLRGEQMFTNFIMQKILK